ncbi:26764_t:CDS:2, partial [Dentiscutata erythropus]
HDTRHKSKESNNSTLAKTLSSSGPERCVSPSTTTSGTTISTSTDWLDMLEQENAKENVIESLQTTVFQEDNSTAPQKESSMKKDQPLLYESTPIQSDQWVVIFDITNDANLTLRIPRYINIMDQKVTTEWKEAPKLCYFCDGEGHLKRDCEQLKEANKLNQHYKKYKETKKQTTVKKTSDGALMLERGETINIQKNNDQVHNPQEITLYDPDVDMERTNDTTTEFSPKPHTGTPILPDIEFSNSETSVSDSKTNVLTTNRMDCDNQEVLNSTSLKEGQSDTEDRFIEVRNSKKKRKISSGSGNKNPNQYHK